MAKDNVVFAILGNSLDAGYSERRWDRWRPTPSLVGHVDELPVSRVELIYTNPDHEKLLDVVVADIKKQSPVTEVRTHFIGMDDPWDFPSTYGAFFDLAQGYGFDTSKEDYFIQLSTGTHVAKICLFLLAEARIFPAQLLTTRPVEVREAAAADIWRGKLHVVDLSRSRYAAIASRFQKVQVTHTDLLRNGIETRNAKFNAMIDRVEKVAMRSNAPMLITGPTGAGKSQLAGRIYQLRKNNQLLSGPFVEVNCATIRGDNALSALFGHKKGSFTGAVTERKGFLLEADGGCAFLDEIGELGLEEQAMLLKALEEKQFAPLGSDKLVSSNFQLIAGTNKDLTAEVAAGRFRADLLARLNVWTFELPGLAARKEDIEPNVEHEIRRQCKELNRLISFNADARKAYLAFLMQAPLTGNFRDLGSSIQRMATLADGGRICMDDVQLEIEILTRSWGGAVASTSDGRLATDSTPWADAYFGEAVADMSSLERKQVDLLLAQVVHCTSMADVGRLLLAPGQVASASFNPSDRGRKLLKQHGIDFHLARTRLASLSQ